VLVYPVGLGDLHVGEPGIAKRLLELDPGEGAAMQPVHCSVSARVCASMSGSAITSETANRPPGRSTRAASRSTTALSAARLMTQLEITTSTLLSGSGTSSR
jgi:hypothetical protein